MSDPAQYYLLINDQEEGPFTLNQVRSMWNAGRLNLNTLFCHPGYAEWRRLSEILASIEPPPIKPHPAPPMATPNQAQGIQVYRPQKSRGTYIILGLFLGCLGIHNFYAGHRVQGAAQLVVTLLLGWVFIGLVITVLWSLAEICTVDEDGDGVKMT
jgi:TM2 domain-containing membrane protein YozV